MLPEGVAGVIVDGDTAEWPGDLAAWADEHDLYLRFTVENEQLTLQSSGRTVSIMLDVDGSASTGLVPQGAPLNSLGVDLEIQLSPLAQNGGTQPGAAVLLHTPEGVRRLRAGAVNFAVTPTYAASWYEARITRTPGRDLGLPQGGLLSSGSVSGVIAMLDPTGGVEAFADPFAVAVEPVCAGGPRKIDVPAPAKPDGALRVLSYNVERSSPATNPDAFRRVVGALRPDVVLLQEWDAGDAAAMAAWFKSTDGADWHVAKAAGLISGGGGVAIASRFPVTPLPGGLTTNDASGSRPVRFVGAVVSAPGGEVLVGSVHLKCCGSAGTSEDQRRMAEARAVNTMLRATADAYPGAIRIVGGDLNLVGSRPPLDILRAGLDADGSDLSVAAPVVVGDVTLTTWRGEDSPYPPGRLDYLVYSDANADVRQSFVFDSSMFTDNALAAMGVTASDCAASDHLPMVIDLVRR
jgi:endonuclease/exonuclease/phosphatase family metal-dependent hydrolase